MYVIKNVYIKIFPDLRTYVCMYVYLRTRKLFRNRILRTYVRNVYRYHRNEIFAAIRNEYTDWEKPIQHPINIRDATLDSLSDGAVAAPALRLAQLHARRGSTTYFAHFAHQTKDADYPQVLIIVMPNRRVCVGVNSSRLVPLNS